MINLRVSTSESYFPDLPDAVQPLDQPPFLLVRPCPHQILRWSFPRAARRQSDKLRRLPGSNQCRAVYYRFVDFCYCISRFKTKLFSSWKVMKICWNLTYSLHWLTLYRINSFWVWFSKKSRFYSGRAALACQLCAMGVLDEASISLQSEVFFLYFLISHFSLSCVGSTKKCSMHMGIL